MQPLHDPTFQAFSRLMHEAIGVHFGPAKKPLVASRLAPRIQKLGLAGYEAYLDLISGHGGDGATGGEFQMADDLLTTNETYFFREPAHFTLIEQEIARTRPQALAAWSAASSFGDEAYSLAMLLADLQQRGQLGGDWRVLGTDISDRVLRSAIEAVYPEDRLRQVSPERLRRHCLRGSGESAGLVQVRPELRQRVRFGQLNLCLPIEDIGPFDIVMLRNVLIYFDSAAKKRIVESVVQQLRPGGLLFIGHSETLNGVTEVARPVVPTVYRRPA